ncbi:hypothetical protein [Pseudoalteromonas gelatinilytica]|uniref:Uncharacterized protein n=1 Tax=Pseudoalteromonas gelatinilytica TaxID=1703256 RepID=A0ABQ1TDK2_9GAMM|nr:hypothetical protein [Pseudoalteromonas profundi]GGE91380.1 hypothetical protein GCM10008027_15310 [Pseudoalteromonas profundi]
MKFETVYKKAKMEIKRKEFSDDYSYEIYLYNKFVEIINFNENFVKAWRWNIQQNAMLSIHQGKEHIKMMLRQVYAAYFQINVGDLL